MKRILSILILLVSNSLFAQSNISVGRKAPDITITQWLKNKPLDTNLKDKYIVLEFWATWCGPCLAAVPHLNEIQDEFARDDLYFISLTDEVASKTVNTLKRIDFHSIVATDTTQQTQINFGDGIKGLEEYPLTVLIDNNGIVRWIGEPKQLNSEIMSQFLRNESINQKASNTTSDQTGVNSTEPAKKIGFKELMQNQEITEYFHLEPAQTDRNLKVSVKGILGLWSYTLLKIYTGPLETEWYRVSIPEKLQKTEYDILYKNTKSPNDLGLLEAEILDQLNLNKEVSQKELSIHNISIRKEKLLEPTANQDLSATSDAGNKTIFTARTISEMLKTASYKVDEVFLYEGTNDNKYDFIIDVSSKESVISDLKSYGLGINKTSKEVTYITITQSDNK